MRLFSWNVNGVRAIEKKGFLNWVDNASPDILCIQETKANFDQLPESLQNIHGYHGYWHSGVRKGYSGVATFCKHEPLDVQYGLGIEKYDREGRGRVYCTLFQRRRYVVGLFCAVYAAQSQRT